MDVAGQPHWLLFEESVELTKDLAEIKPIHLISVGFLEDPTHWIHLPSTIEIWTSHNGVDFELAAKRKNRNESQSTKSQIKSFRFKTSKDFRYLKLKASMADNLSLKNSILDKKPILAMDEIFLQQKTVN